MKLYQEDLMNHYRYPHNRGTLAEPDFCSGQYNPSCGDEVSIQATVIGTCIAKLAFEGKGCVISQATASMLTLDCANKPLDDILALDCQYIFGLIGSELGPTRAKCALLPLMALQQGIKKFKKEL